MKLVEAQTAGSGRNSDKVDCKDRSSLCDIRLPHRRNSDKVDCKEKSKKNSKQYREQ